MYSLNPESPADKAEVENLFDLAFAPGREALSSYRLRAGIEPVHAICLVARDGQGILAGAIRFWPVRVEDAECLLLGPVAVHPTRQGEGLGKLLIEGSLDLARDLGWRRVILIGDEPYYARFGFSIAANLEFPPPTNPKRLLFRSLEPGAFDGIEGMVRRCDA